MTPRNREELAAQIYVETIVRQESHPLEGREEMLEKARKTARGSLLLAGIFWEEVEKSREEQV
ncbi:hypothetical protein [Deinococcus sp. Leaf326]|uniref:hypothetical protein n=1 Tax=Deinococcus sp. Leaf326 TaxID=1736338 RepID=UPI0006F51D40|nr:hypothetical protein [Deinococcus sp. Leaf326]KQR22901.1 hypothetical protein ASF71_06960 [Deinococcus sp. Leaf326]